MHLILRYCGLALLSLALPLALLVPTSGGPDNLVGFLARIMVLPIYGCLAVVLMTTWRPAQMRQRLQQTPNPIDDLHLWLGPLLVILAFLWAGFMLIGFLATSGFHESNPAIFLLFAAGSIVLAVWMGIRVRRAFLYGTA